MTARPTRQAHEQCRAQPGRVPAGWPVLQAALATGAAWALAQQIPGHEQPFLAPISAVLVLGASIGR